MIYTISGSIIGSSRREVVMEEASSEIARETARTFPVKNGGIVVHWWLLFRREVQVLSSNPFPAEAEI